VLLTAPEPKAERGRVVLSVGEEQTISAVVTAENCEDCLIELNVDPTQLETVAGSQVIELGSGSFEQTIEWRLRGIAPVDDGIVGITVRERELTAPHPYFLPLKIHPSLITED